MTGERRVSIRRALRLACPRRLAVDRVIEHRGDGIAARIGKIEKMPGHGVPFQAVAGGV